MPVVSVEKQPQWRPEQKTTVAIKLKDMPVFVPEFTREFAPNPWGDRRAERVAVVAGNLREFQAWARNQIRLQGPDVHYVFEEARGRLTVNGTRYEYIRDAVDLRGVRWSDGFFHGTGYDRQDFDEIRQALNYERMTRG